MSDTHNDNNTDSESKPAQSSQRKIHCPSCNTEIVWSTDNPWRPFCSETCKNKDFIGWANEQHRIPTDDDENYDE